MITEEQQIVFPQAFNEIVYRELHISFTNRELNRALID